VSRRLITTTGLTFGLLWATAIAALALPGEGFGLEPYGHTPAGPSGTTTTTTATGFDPSFAQAVIAVIVVGVVLGIVGYLVGTARQHRAMAH
jgi:hypothetical protein